MGPASGSGRVKEITVSKSRLLRLVALLFDLCVCFFAFLFAHIIAFTPSWAFVVENAEARALSFVAAGAISISVMRLNRGVWQYASIPDMIAIFKAATLMVGLFVTFTLLTGGATMLSGLAMFLVWLFVMIGMGGGRLAYRMIKETVLLPHFLSQSATSVALLFPFSDTTETYIRALRRDRAADRRIAGIVDSGKTNSKRVLHGVPVLGKPEALTAIVRDREQRGQPINELIVTDPNISGLEMAELLEHCNKAGLAIKRLPALINSVDAALDMPITPSPVRLDDLLGRPQVPADPAAVRAFLAGKTVLVTGAGGSIGSELVMQIAEFAPTRIILVDAGEQNLYDIGRALRYSHPEIPLSQLLCDIRDSARVNTIMQRELPDVVFHAAAIKHVPIAENNPIEAAKTNALGTAIVADAAVRAEVKAFVLISTDKAVNPASVMGATKRAAELYCQSLDLADSPTRFRIVRFGNVLGSAGSVVPLFQEQIARGGPVTVTDPDVERYFMTVQEAVHLILEAVSHGQERHSEKGAVLVLDMGNPVKIIDLARRVIQLAGFVPDRDIAISFTGLRPGEKLTEELVNQTEDDVIQRRKGYFIARTRTVETTIVREWFATLREACRREDRQAVVEGLKTMVPSFIELENGRVPLPDPHDAQTITGYPSRRLH
jgi:FlaA1/EpsC-like NDP-sugar epimerase